MKALVKTKTGKGHLELIDVNEPKPIAKEVKIKVEYAGICGTDIHIYYDEFPTTPPITLGHEFSGTIVDIGEEVTRFKIGDKVVAENSWSSCEICSLCRKGRDTLCTERVCVGVSQNGVFAKYVLYKERLIHLIPENVDMLSAALTEPMACAVHGVVERSRINSGDIVIVSGPGPIGLFSMQIAKSMGAIVIVTGISLDQKRLDIAKKLGADYAVNIQKEDIKNLVSKLTNSEGADVVLECSGAESAVDQGIDLLKKCGIFTQIGLHGKPIKIDFEKICFKELDVYGSLSQTNFAYKRTLALLSEKKVNSKALVTHIFPLEEWEKGFKIAEQKKGLKVVLKP
ncbi:MAG: zinc-binding dehydrogenase [Atribacterota bacterium]